MSSGQSPPAVWSRTRASTYSASEQPRLRCLSLRLAAMKSGSLSERKAREVASSPGRKAIYVASVCVQACAPYRYIVYNNASTKTRLSALFLGSQQITRRTGIRPSGHSDRRKQNPSDWGPWVRQVIFGQTTFQGRVLPST